MYTIKNCRNAFLKFLNNNSNNSEYFSIERIL